MGYLHQFFGYGDTMLSEFWGYLPYLFEGYGIYFKIIKGILGPPPPSMASIQNRIFILESNKRVLLTNIVDPGEMSQIATFNQGLHCFHR